VNFPRPPGLGDPACFAACPAVLLFQIDCQAAVANCIKYFLTYIFMLLATFYLLADTAAAAGAAAAAAGALRPGVGLTCSWGAGCPQP
jgi:hypothetical protein